MNMFETCKTILKDRWISASFRRQWLIGVIIAGIAMIMVAPNYWYVSTPIAVVLFILGYFIPNQLETFVSGMKKIWKKHDKKNRSVIKKSKEDETRRKFDKFMQNNVNVHEGFPLNQRGSPMDSNSETGINDQQSYARWLYAKR